MTSAFGLQIAIVLGALAWKGQRLRRSGQFIPASGVGSTILVALAALTLTLLLHLPPGHRGGPRGLVAHLVQLGQNTTLIATFAALQLLYLGYHPEQGRRYSGRWEILIAGSVVAVLTALTCWAVLTNNSLSYSLATLHRPVVAAFFLLPTAYVLYAAGCHAVYGLRYATQSQSWTRAGALGLTATGITLLFAATALRAFITLSTVTGNGFPIGLRETASGLISIGNPSVACGLVVPLVASRVTAGLTRMRARRLFRELEPLWTLLSWTYPELVRPAHPAPLAADQATRPATSGTGPTGQAGSPSIGFLAANRRTECRDGLSMLRPYLIGEQPTPADSRVARAVREIADTTADITTSVTALSVTALSVTDPSVNPGPGNAGRRAAYLADTRQLVAISRALTSRDLSWCTTNTKEHV